MFDRKAFSSAIDPFETSYSLFFHYLLLIILRKRWHLVEKLSFENESFLVYLQHYQNWMLYPEMAVGPTVNWKVQMECFYGYPSSKWCHFDSTKLIIFGSKMDITVTYLLSITWRSILTQKIDVTSKSQYWLLNSKQFKNQLIIIKIYICHYYL